MQNIPAKLKKNITYYKMALVCQVTGGIAIRKKKYCLGIVQFKSVQIKNIGYLVLNGRDRFIPNFQYTNTKKS